MSKRSKRTTRARNKELGLFTVAGAVVTGTDYGVLNVLTGLFGWPLVLANIVSATLASALGYVLNRKVVFEGRMHSEQVTIALYIATVLVSILVIQSSILYVLDNGVMLNFVKSLGVSGESAELIATNASKLVAGLAVLIWNFMTQRRYVFKSVDRPKN